MSVKNRRQFITLNAGLGYPRCMQFVPMSPDFSDSAALGLFRWFQTPAGQALLADERRVIDPCLRALFAPLTVQVSGAGSLLTQSKSAHRIWVVARESLGDRDTPALVARPSELPLASDSVDVVVLHHTLDVTRHPHSVLREAIRVLRPGGTILIIGFDPLGPLRWSKAPLGRRVWPALGISSKRLSDWLGLLNCPPERVERLGYPDVAGWLAKRQWWGNTCTLVVARKQRVIPPRALRQRLRGRLAQIKPQTASAKTG